MDIKHLTDEVEKIKLDAKAEGVPDLGELMAKSSTNNEVVNTILPGFADFYSNILKGIKESGEINRYKGYMAEVSFLSYWHSATPRATIQEIVHMAFHLGRYSVLKAKH